MGSRITDVAVSDALAILESLRNPQWVDIYWEFQEGGSNILFVVNVLGLSESEIDSSCSTRITSAFDRLFPSPADDIVWVVTFYDHNLLVTAYNGAVVASNAP